MTVRTAYGTLFKLHLFSSFGFDSIDRLFLRMFCKQTKFRFWVQN